MSTNVCPALWFSAANMRAGETDRADLRLRRQLAAAEAVHPDRRARPGHLLEHLLHLVGIVRQRVDLLFRQDVAEALALGIRGGGGRVAADRDALVDLLDGSVLRAGCPPRARGRPGSSGPRTRETDRDGVASDRDLTAVATPCPSELTTGTTTSWVAGSVPLITTAALGITAPLGSRTTTRSVPVERGCAAAGAVPAAETASTSKAMSVFMGPGLLSCRRRSASDRSSD